MKSTQFLKYNQITYPLKCLEAATMVKVCHTVLFHNVYFNLCYFKFVLFYDVLFHNVLFNVNNIV